jgi:hypothetical protein
MIVTQVTPTGYQQSFSFEAKRNDRRRRDVTNNGSEREAPKPEEDEKRQGELAVA